MVYLHRRKNINPFLESLFCGQKILTKKYKHLFFDLDHTIWDFETNARESMEILFGQLDLEKKINVPFGEYYEVYSRHNREMWRRYELREISREDLRWKRMYKTLLDFKIGDEELSRYMAEEFLNILPTRKNLFPYTIEILQYLLSKNYVLHLITNGFDTVQFSKIKHSKIGHFFTDIITSEASNSMKPHKEIFEFALQKTGAQLQESIMIGDNLEADISGAINAGMDCIFVNHLSVDTLGIKPTYVVHHLQQLEDIF